MAKIIETVNLGYKLGHCSIEHNICAIRKALKKWAKQYIKIGTYSEWKSAARNSKFPADFSSVKLFIDSTDLHIKRSDYWSGKEQRPAWCFMVISDTKGVIRKIWTPKLYDGHFYQANKDYVEETLLVATS